MKLSPTTPVLRSKKTKQKIGALVFVVILFLVLPIQMMNGIKVGATCQTVEECDAEITARQKDIAEYEKESSRLNKQALSLRSTIATIASEKAIIQAKLDISQAKYNKLVKQIAETKTKIKANQSALGDVLADLYVDDKITPIEMLASSKTISDYLDKQEYRSSVRDQLTSTITDIKQLKVSLENKKEEVAVVLKQQKSERNALAAKESEQRNILSVTEGQEANYQRLIEDNESAIAQARALQAAMTARFSGTGGYVLIDGGSLRDYPWNQSNCPMWGFLSTGGADGNGGDGHGYGCRQCASYVAWRFAKETNVYPSWGNAWQFTAGAKSLGYKEGGAQAGSIAVMDPATAGNVYYGHVAWVESDPYVNGSGQTVIQVSQYNYNFGWGYGMYSLMELSVNAFDHYIHIK